MPSGVVHERVNLAVLGGLAAAYWGLGQPTPKQAALAFVVAYLVGTLWITPDLDLAEQRVRSKRNWGMLAVLWYPYGKLSRHRGMSHSWIVGPAIRLAYIGAITWLLYTLVVAVAAAMEVKGFGITMVVPPSEVTLGAVAGYWVSQWIHLMLDGMWPDFAKKR